MAKITRAVMKIFGSSAGLNQIGKFGSAAAGAPAYTTDPTVIQSLANYLTGWFGAVLGANSPAIEDMNAIHYLYAYQLAYLFQQGIAEWETATVYYKGSMVNSAGIIFVSLTDANTGNALTDTTNWKVYGQAFKTVTGTYTANILDDIIKGDTTGGVFTITLPSIATSINKKFVFKNIGYNALTIKANGAELMDGVNDSSLLPVNPVGIQYGTMTLVNNGTSWDVF